MAKKATDWVRVRIPMEYDGTPGYDPVSDLGPEYAHLADPRTEIGELFFPQRFTPEVVASMKEDLGEYGSSGQLQQSPSPLGGGILKSKWWRTWGEYGWTKGRALPTVKHVFASWDTAFSEKDMTNSAYSAMTLWGVFWDEERSRDALILLSAWWDRVDYPDLQAKAMQISKEKLTHPSDAHLIEKKASGISLIQSLNRNPKLRIRSYIPKPGEDKVQRAYMAQPMLQAGLLYVPDSEKARQVVSLVSEFPAGGPPCADLTDTVTQAVAYLQRGWWLTHPDDEDAAPDYTERAESDEDDDATATMKAVGYG
jgi:predicted phage terminase large subunit-like protein